MPLLFKGVGLLLIFTVCSAFGFLKSTALRKRAERLSEWARCISRLSEYIRADKSEIDSLIKKCFGTDRAFFTDNGIRFDKGFLKAEDTAILDELFSVLGTADAEGEYRRTLMYSALVEKQARLAEDECGKLCKLYSVLGVLGGIFICVFFI